MRVPGLELCASNCISCGFLQSSKRAEVRLCIRDALAKRALPRGSILQFQDRAHAIAVRPERSERQPLWQLRDLPSLHEQLSSRLLLLFQHTGNARKQPLPLPIALQVLLPLPLSPRLLRGVQSFCLIIASLFQHRQLLPPAMDPLLRTRRSMLLPNRNCLLHIFCSPLSLAWQPEATHAKTDMRLARTCCISVLPQNRHGCNQRRPKVNTLHQTSHHTFLELKEADVYVQRIV
mmetsp:Transcript_4204/g.15747  ORF Transcript_4204/g.15747 Transcript_4204/m.15747 type:complete len:234 (-) Transcript_4204:550-1251(-)